MRFYLILIHHRNGEKYDFHVGGAIPVVFASLIPNEAKKPGNLAATISFS